MPDSNTTYHAKWTRLTYDITYSGMDNATHNNPTTYTVETPTFTLEEPVWPGYEFLGWTPSGSQVTQQTVTIEKGTTGDLSFTATWREITYTITYPYTYDVVSGNPTSYTVEDTDDGMISLTPPAGRQGYTFAGWTMTVDGVSYLLTASADGSYAIPQGTLGNITLTGLWLAQDQTITLNANGGVFADGNETATITAEYGSSVTLTTPTRSGYTFAGWYTDAACTTPFDGIVPLSTTLYAGWTAIPTDDDDNGSSGSSDSDPSYSPILDVSDGGEIKVSPRTPEEDEEVTITVDPDAGYELDELTVTDRNGDEIDVDRVSSTRYTFEMPRGRVTVEASFVRTGESTFFTDVPESFWAYDEIKWAYDNGYVNGTSDTTFSPNSSISRQQVWMILARLSGADPASMAEARQWAMENGISDGTTPGNAVTRQQLVALLYRYATLMGYANYARSDLNSYPDAGTVASYAVEPMQWSVANSIVAGTSDGTLNPTGTATRAQFAVILYRFWNQIG